MKYKKRSIEIEAIQYDGTGEGWEKLLDFVGEDLYADDDGRVFIDTLEGELTVSVGDFVIKGIAGEFYPCKPDIFAKTYEPCDEDDEK